MFVGRVTETAATTAAGHRDCPWAHTTAKVHIEPKRERDTKQLKETGHLGWAGGRPHAKTGRGLPGELRWRLGRGGHGSGQQQCGRGGYDGPNRRQGTDGHRHSGYRPDAGAARKAAMLRVPRKGAWLRHVGHPGRGPQISVSPRPAWLQFSS